MRRVITFNVWLRIDVVMMQRCYNAVFRYIFISMTFLTCWQIFPDYAAPPCNSNAIASIATNSMHQLHCMHMKLVFSAGIAVNYKLTSCY